MGSPTKKTSESKNEIFSFFFLLCLPIKQNAFYSEAIFFFWGGGEGKIA